MANRWRRWRGYMDELEEVARICGRQIAEAEACIGETYERPTWSSTQEAGIAPELVRRALDIPFLGDLVRAAWSVGPCEANPPDAPYRPWNERERVVAQRSADRRVGSEPPSTPASRGHAPARLRSAERALADRTRSVAVLLEEVANPRNVSAVVRTADAFGHQEMHVVEPRGRARMLRTVTMTAEKYLDLYWYRSTAAAVESLRSRGYRILAADHAPTAVPIDEVDLGDRVAVAFGSEQRGVSAALRGAADGLFYIPTSGFTSFLNVSVAAALSLYEIDRRMRQEGRRAALDEADRAALRRSWYSTLAGHREDRRREYLAWTKDPPPPAPVLRCSREREP